MPNFVIYKHVDPPGSQDEDFFSGGKQGIENEFFVENAIDTNNEFRQIGTEQVSMFISNQFN